MLAGAAGAFETCTVEADRGLSQSQDRPAGEVIRTPDQRLRVFVSSTLGELAEERRAVSRAITALRLTPVMFELGARPHPPQALRIRNRASVDRRESRTQHRCGHAPAVRGQSARLSSQYGGGPRPPHE